jgi:transposase
MKERSTHVGLDVHKKQIAVALLRPGDSEPVEWKSANEPRAIRRLARRIEREAEGEVVCVYEAGPCGYTPQRQLESYGLRVQVVAPSLIPRKPGERIKTDRRDARKLASLSQAGLLTQVRPPSEEEEAVRDLCRCREAARQDLTRARHRLSKMLLRQGRVYRTGRSWTQAHRRWLRSLSFERAAARITFEHYLLAIEQLEERLLALEAELDAIAGEAPYREPVGWLRCFRGIDTVSALTIVAELHDFRRFENPRRLMAYLGLVPGERSSGERTQRGGITKAGNRHVRRVLVEAAWHYRHRPAVGKALRRRREGQPTQVIALADRAQVRLHRRFYRLVLNNHKPTQKAVVAVARELVGFLWATLYLNLEIEPEQKAV